MTERRKIRVEGIVQGVGFRPFVYRLANQLALRGHVLNDAFGVLIDVEGENGKLDVFINSLKTQAPPLSKIVTVREQVAIPVGYTNFDIHASKSEPGRSVLISADIAVCDDCLAELFDPQDRRFRYPFINCTNCGPRYTITNDIPYDRSNTSMTVFEMCRDCQQEYDDPTNRRFHAQPNACAVCGPMVKLVDANCNPVISDDPIRTAAEFLQEGQIVAIKGLGGFHLAVNAVDDKAVRRLRTKKHREEKPLAVMVPNVTVVQTVVEIDARELAILESPERPIVLLRKTSQNIIAENVAPANAFLGIMLPYTPLHHVLIREGFTALVMTSANISEEPIAIDNDEAFQRLGDIADYFLIHDRDILLRSDDSVVRVVSGTALPIRRSRGYVPVPILCHKKLRPVLACGGELKNTICLTKDRNAFLSQHVGDMENLETLGFFEECVDHLQRILEIEPEIIAHDLHPRYLTSQWAKDQSGVDLVGVQHHHAHIASCLAEHGKDGPVIGLAMDGTGYGIDGNVWGGEVLVADWYDFQRFAYFEYVPMPGGEQAIKEPWRMALAYLNHVFDNTLWDLPINFIKRLDKNNAQTLIRAADQHINSPLTSSLGRLFDGIAALVGLRERVAFEGQAAMELEMVMYTNRTTAINVNDHYAFDFQSQEDTVQIMISRVVKQIVDDVMGNVSPSVISAKFHSALVSAFLEICKLMRKRTGINKVALSGGCFQNHYLTSHLSQQLVQAGFEVLTHLVVPPNDGGLSLGQAVIASSRVSRRAD